MKSYVGPKGTRFEYARELDGNVFIEGVKRSFATPEPRIGRFQGTVPGADLLAFFKYLMDECVEEAVQEVGGEPV